MFDVSKYAQQASTRIHPAMDTGHDIAYSAAPRLLVRLLGLGKPQEANSLDDVASLAHGAAK